MKPTSPEDQELEKSSAEVSEHYRAAAQDEPPSRVDVAVLEAARREVKQPARRRRDWQIPASVAAMVIIGVAMALLVRENQAPPSLDVVNEAKLARQTSPQMAMKTPPKANTDSVRERPSRERSPRPDRTLSSQEQMAPAARDSAAPDNVANRAAAPASAPAPAKPAESASIAAAESKKSESMSDAAAQSRRSDQALLKQKADNSIAQPEDWLRRIDDLLREGKKADAREQVQVFQKAYPEFVLPQRFKALLVEQH
ncbi:MAG TPA: hypothetical protein VN496_08255 [Burkholderiales bacterium]|nr:hypothetical protein [Burkholderiales bacterium]